MILSRLSWASPMASRAYGARGSLAGVGTVPAGSGGSSTDLDGSGATVHSNRFSVAEPERRVPGCNYCGNAVFAGDERGVCGERAAVGDDGRGPVEQWGPRGRGESGDEHFSASEAVEVFRTAHDPNRSGRASGTGGFTHEDRVGRYGPGACGLRGAVHKVADGLRWRAQSERGSQPALPFPPVPAIGDHPPEIFLTVHFVAGEEEDILRGVEDARGGEDLAQTERATPQQRPGEGEVPRLLLPQNGVSLRHLQEGVEPGELLGPVSKHGTARLFGGFPLGCDLRPADTVTNIFAGFTTLASDAEFAEGGMVPVDAQRGVRRYSRVHTG